MMIVYDVIMYSGVDSVADKLSYYKNCAFFEKSMKFLT